MTYSASGRVVLDVNLSDYPIAKALRRGEVRSDIVELNFCGPTPASKGFKPMVREGRFDAGELAIVTFLQALEYKKPLVLLPAVVLAHLQHPHLVRNIEKRPRLTPKDLEGRRVATRAYSQTTAVWLRGFLQHDFGVDLEKVEWVCWEEAHPAEYRDPPNVTRAPPTSKSLNEMLLDGEVDAAIAGSDLLGNPIVKSVFENPAAADEAWSRSNGGAIPINHMFVIRKELSETRPDVVREIWRLLKASKKAAPESAHGIERNRFGLEANRASLERVIAYAHEQKLITRRFDVDELFDATTRALD